MCITNKIFNMFSRGDKIYLQPFTVIPADESPRFVANASISSKKITQGATLYYYIEYIKNKDRMNIFFRESVLIIWRKFEYDYVDINIKFKIGIILFYSKFSYMTFLHV